MISRSKSKLDEKAKEVQELNPNIKIKTIEFNFNRHLDKTAYEELFKELDKFDISLLINNVGYSHTVKGKQLHSLDDDLVCSFYQINTIPMIYMSKYFLGKAIKREGKKSGMLNVSSLMALISLPGSGLYTGSKGFVDNFTKSLAATRIYKDIDISSLNTCGVATNMNEGKLMFSCQPEEYAKQALNVLGNRVHDTGHFKHHLHLSFIRNPLTVWIVLIDAYRNADTLGKCAYQKPVSDK